MSSDTPGARQRQLLRLARALVSDSPSADDLVQDAWVLALRGGDRAPPTAWLRRTLTFLSLNHRRGEERRRARYLRLRPRDPAPTPLEETAHRQVLAHVRDAVNRLPPKYQQIIRLRFYEGLPPAEIGRQLGISVNTVHTRSRRALAQLRSSLDRHHGGHRSQWVALLLPLRPARRDPLPTLTRPTHRRQRLAWKLAALVFVGGLTYLAVDRARAPASIAQVTEAAALRENGTQSGPAQDSAPRSLPSRRLRRGEVTQTQAPTKHSSGLSVQVLDARSGLPLPNLDVLVGRNDLRQGTPVRQLRSDEEGLLPLGELAPGPWTLAPVRGKRHTIQVSADASQKITLPVPHGLLVSGRVRHQQRPVPDVSIYASWRDLPWHTREVARTDAQGAFVAADLDPHSWIQARGHNASSDGYSLDGPQNGRVELSIEVYESHHLRGTVLDDRGLPLAGATISSPRPPSHTVQRFRLDGERSIQLLHPASHSDDRGHFAHPQPRTRSRHSPHLLIQHPSLAPGVVRFEQGQPLPVLRLKKGAVLRGRVRDANGNPVSLVPIQLTQQHPLPSRWTQTDPQGNFHLAHLAAGQVFVRVNHGPDSHRGTAEATLSLHEGESREWNPQLDAARLSMGQALNERGEPLSGWQVLVRVKEDQVATEVLAPEMAVRQWTRTDAQGRFVILGELGRENLVTLHPPGPRDTPAHALWRGKLPARSALKLMARRPRASVQGQVLGLENAPVELLLLSDALHPFRRFPLPASGHFQVHDLPAGHYHLWTWKTGQAPQPARSFTLAPDSAQQLGSLSVGAMGSLHVEIREAGSGDPASARVRLQRGLLQTFRDTRDPASQREARSDSEFFWANLPVGDYNLRTFARGFMSEDGAVSIRANQTTRVVREMGKGHRVMFTISWDRTWPTEYFRLTAMRNAPDSKPIRDITWPAILGRTEIRDALRLPPGNFRLFVQSSHGQTTSTEITVAPDDPPRRIELRLRNSLGASRR